MKFQYHLLAATLLMFGGISADAQQKAAPTKQDSIRQHYRELIKSDKPEDKAKVREGINHYANTDNENDVQLAIRIAVDNKQSATADSLVNVAVARYPNGRFALTKQYNAIVSTKAPAAEKERMYKEFVAKFPEPATLDITYDYARSEVAHTYALEKNAAKSLEWLYQIKSQTYLCIVELSDGQTFITNKDTITGEKLIKSSVAHAKATVDKNEDPNAKNNYFYGVAKLASLYYHEHKYAEALTYATEAYQGSSRKSPEMTETYALALTANNQGKTALPLFTELMTTGKASKEMKSKLKEAYVQAYGNDAGYTGYLDNLQAKLKESTTAGLAKQMISEAAPEFTLVDVKGTQVSLAELKGKVVILDFWATWCGPCKRSFPAMQMALNKYKNDPDVKFLFIDTWERIPDPSKDVKSFLTENKYSFQVLLDNSKTKVVDKFGITGIPAKFVIDKNGKIRFKLTGFDGADDAAVEEISAMIEAAKKQS